MIIPAFPAGRLLSEEAYAIKMLIAKSCSQFFLTVKEGISRDALVHHLESNNIQTRNLFAGNLTKHPCFDQMRETGEGYRIVGDLHNTDRIMKDTFWIGVSPLMTDAKLDKMIKEIHNGIKEQVK